MAAWKVTVRNGSDVSRSGFDDLDQAIAEARRQTDMIRSEGPMAPVKAIRDYEPDQLIRARIEISGKGFLKAPTAGVDIHGDLSLTGFTGGVRREAFATDSEREIFARIREALAG